MKVEWKEVPGFNGKYEFSNTCELRTVGHTHTGRNGVVRTREGKTVKPYDKYGVRTYGLAAPGDKIQCTMTHYALYRLCFEEETKQEFFYKGTRSSMQAIHEWHQKHGTYRGISEHDK